MKRFSLIVILLITYISLFTGCRESFDVTIHSNDRYTVELDGFTRTFYIKVPVNYDENKTYALIFYLHGAGQTAFEVSNDGFTEIAHDSDYIIVYPGAKMGSWKLYNSSDVDYIDRLIRYTKKSYNINRVFVAGFSLGGFMAAKLAFEIPKKISGISILSGSIFPEHLPQKQLPISIQHIHALDDNGIPYNGTKDQVLSVPESITYWKGINRTQINPTTLYTGSEFNIKRWDSEHTNCSVELITYEKGGHRLLPGSPEFVINFFNRVEK